MRSKRRRRRMGPIVPVWWQNALHAWQIALAAPEVIAHRTARMALAGSVPSARDRREFSRMGREKLEAFGESLSAMAMQTYMLHQELTVLTVEQWWSAWMPLAQLTASSSPAQVAKSQSALMWGLAAAMGDQRLADSLSRVVQKGLAPVHKSATANARRLRGVKIR